MAGKNTNDLTDQNFGSEVLQSEGLAVVDFWATWCGPCLHMAPALDSFAQKNAAKVRVFKVDVDDNPRIANQFQIRSIPTIIFFKDGKPADVVIGAVAESTLQKKLDALAEN